METLLSSVLYTSSCNSLIYMHVGASGKSSPETSVAIQVRDMRASLAFCLKTTQQCQDPGPSYGRSYVGFDTFERGNASWDMRSMN
eukprot:COSAG02_NODE_595_length_19813_cov_12.215380_21_plen_86_part_00